MSITINPNDLSTNYNNYKFPEEILYWYSPNGETPGTYEEYILKNPYQKTEFLQPNINSQNKINNNKTLSILIHNNIYDKVKENVETYLNDLEIQGEIPYLQTIQGGNPEEVKEWIKNQYTEGSKGVILIGDISVAWAEVSDSVFPCDLFYMDLDGKWEDNNNDGIYENHVNGLGDMGPEIYVGRIYVDTIKYDSKANLINEYLDKIHSYRNGNLTQKWKSIEYVDEDWFNMDIFMNYSYGNNVDRYDYGFETTNEDYLDKLNEGNHFVTVCAHSYSGGHHFGRRPTESVVYTHIYVYSPENRDSKILVGCDDGIKIWLNGENIFTKDRLGGWRADQFKIDINLKEGWNKLLFKISQDGGDFKFSSRITDTNYATYDDLEYQLNNPLTYNKSSEYIRSWLINGFHQDTSDNFYYYLDTNYLGLNEGTINPNEGDEMGGKIWTRYDSGNPYINLNEYYNNIDFGATYSYTSINSSYDQNCQLWVGYDDGIRIWLNGDEILSDNRYGPYENDMKKINVTLKEGHNSLIMKISEWMGDYGFSAKFSKPNGEIVEGLNYNIEPKPIDYIGTWLVNGIYENNDPESRLSIDYLENEEKVSPSEKDNASEGIWEFGIGGYPFDIGKFYDKGGWIFSETIQKEDPPVLFYNLFSCGPGRFTDENYLAGAYIYNTTYGLITIASSKSGSMLNFKDFYEPLGRGKSIGGAFIEWFNKQEPYQLWEKEWYYGMVICGDPTLNIYQMSSDKPNIRIIKPENAIYFSDNKLFNFITPVIIGNMSIETKITNPGSGIKNVSFFIDDELIAIVDSIPFYYHFDQRIFGKKTIKVEAIDYNNNIASDSINTFMMNFDKY